MLSMFESHLNEPSIKKFFFIQEENWTRGVIDTKQLFFFKKAFFQCVDYIMVLPFKKNLSFRDDACWNIYRWNDTMCIRFTLMMLFLLPLGWKKFVKGCEPLWFLEYKSYCYPSPLPQLCTEAINHEQWPVFNVILILVSWILFIMRC